MKVLDCHSRSQDPLAKSLSNFVARPFVIDGVHCGSMEGFLQSVKFEDPVLQEAVAILLGYQAFKFGQNGNKWKNDQVLWWRGRPMARNSPEYQNLLRRAYDAQLEQSPDLVEALRATVGMQLVHTMGKNDPADTVLTHLEYIKQLNRIRFRALEEVFNGTVGDPSSNGQEQRETDTHAPSSRVG